MQSFSQGSRRGDGHGRGQHEKKLLITVATVKPHVDDEDLSSFPRRQRCPNFAAPSILSDPERQRSIGWSAQAHTACAAGTRSRAPGSSQGQAWYSGPQSPQRRRLDLMPARPCRHWFSRASGNTIGDNTVPPRQGDSVGARCGVWSLGMLVSMLTLSAVGCHFARTNPTPGI